MGRARTTRIARQRLDSGVNLLLADPRRMGKSEWLKHFQRSQKDRYHVVVIDYEGVETPDAFLTRTVEALLLELPRRDRLWERCRTFLDSTELTVNARVISVKKAFDRVDPMRLLERVIAQVAQDLVHDERRLIIAMDEVPMAALNIVKKESPASADLLLQSLRRIRDSHPAIGWILCGSVGFHHVLRRCGATEGVLNNLDNLPLGPLEAHEADELGWRLLQGAYENPADEDIAHFVAVCGGIPFLMHKIAALLLDLGATGGLCARIDRQFAAFLTDRDESRAVTHLVTRLDGFYEGEDLQSANAILDQVALSARPVPVAEVAPGTGTDASRRRVADHLCDDHYLIDTPDGLTWRYDVLRRIWVARRRLG